MTTLEVSSERTVARPLNVLVPLIKQHLDQAQRASEEYYREAGGLLLEAKSQLKHGEFTPWVKRHFGLSKQHAARYIGFYTATSGAHKSRYETFSDYMRKDGGDPGYGKVIRKKEWHEPVKEQIERARADATRLRDESLTKQQERDAERKLALRLIDIGFKVLAKELHPDKGGSRDVMSRLNRVRTRLQQCA